MVQVVENWAELEGTVKQAVPNPELSAYVTVQIDVERVAPVQGFPNLFTEAVGRTVTFNVPRAVADSKGLRTGMHVIARLRKAGPASAFAHPDHVQVQSS